MRNFYHWLSRALDRASTSSSFRSTLMATVSALILGLVLFALPESAVAAPVPGWSAVALTNDGVLQSNARVDGDYVVWCGTSRAGDQEVYAYHIPTKTTSNISSQPGDDVSVEIDDNHVVWQWYDGHDWEIMLYDLESGRRRQITNNLRHDRHPRIDGRWIVFSSTLTGVGEEIYLYSIQMSTLTRLTDNRLDDYAPSLQDGYPWSDGLVAWHQWDGHDYEIMYRKIGSPYGGRLTNNDYNDGIPVIGAGWIVWEGEQGPDSELFAANVYEDIGGLQLTDDSLDDTNPTVEAGKVVWTKGLDSAAIKWDLYSIDLRFKTGTRLTNDSLSDEGPLLDLWRVAWTRENPDVEAEIMLQRLLGGPAGTLSSEIPSSLWPDLDGPAVTWLFHDGHDWEVALARTTFPFLDVTTTNPHREAIFKLAVMGVVAGRTASGFEPDSPLYRQQYAKMAVLGVGAPVSESDVCPFTDVEVSGPASLFPDNHIAAAQKFGLLLGKTRTTFAPYDNVTRAQAVPSR